MPNEDDYLAVFADLRDRIGGENDSWMEETQTFLWENLYNYKDIHDSIEFLRDDEAFKPFAPSIKNFSGKIVKLPNDDIYNETIKYINDIVGTSVTMLMKLEAVYDNHFQKLIMILKNIEKPLNEDIVKKIIKIMTNERYVQTWATAIISSHTQKSLSEYFLFVELVKIIKDEPSVAERNARLISSETAYDISNSHLERDIMPELREEYHKLMKILTECNQAVDLTISKQIKAIDAFRDLTPLR